MFDSIFGEEKKYSGKGEVIVYIYSSQDHTDGMCMCVWLGAEFIELFTVLTLCSHTYCVYVLYV